MDAWSIAPRDPCRPCRPSPCRAGSGSERASAAEPRPSCPAGAPGWRAPCRIGRWPRTRGYRRGPRWVRDDHVIGFGDGNLQLVGLDRADVLAVGVTTVMARPGMRTLKIDMAEALMMRRRTRSPGRNRPVQFSSGPWAVDQIGVGRTVDVQDVARVHPHRPPHSPFLKAHPVRPVDQAGQCGALAIEIAGGSSSACPESGGDAGSSSPTAPAHARGHRRPDRPPPGR